MSPLLHRGLALILLGAGGGVPAQVLPSNQAAQAASAASAPLRAAADSQRRVLEDDGVRIEEFRVRGQLQRVIVRSKVGGARTYEIIVGPGGRDPSQERGTAGQRAWSLFDF